MTFLHPETEYAVWNGPGAERSVHYWLPLFHEIDFQVNEGFRRIPHGGIETGGLLFGRADEKSIHIEAFRPIECEHSRGPSFVLSERDIARLREQIAAAPADPELKNFELLGWFVSHTRSALELNETEARLFQDLFSAGKLMILIKPERFQPTRFLFLAAGADKKLSGSGVADAIILPLPGRSQRSETGAMPSDAAPALKTPEGPVAASDGTVKEPLPESPKSAPEGTSSLAEISKTGEPAPGPGKEVVVSPAKEPAGASKEPASPGTGSIPAAVQDLPSAEEIRRRRSELFKSEAVETTVAPREVTKPTVRRARRSNTQLAIVLFIAAALGCGVGYTIYLLLPPAVIPVDIQKHAPMITVSWPPEQTRDAGYAALRVDDGDPIPLSAQQKSEGRAEIPSKSGTMKVELIAQHWMRDSRGIVRYIEPLAPPQTAVSTTPAAQ